MTKSLSIAVLVTCSFVMCGSSFAQQLTPQQAEAKRFLEEERKLAKQAGLPLSPKDLKEAVVPASQNLATYLTEFSNRKNKKVLGDDNYLIHDRLLSWELPTPQDTQKAIALFQRCEDLWSLIEKGLSCPFYSTPTEGATLPYVSFPQNAIVRSQAQWILARTTLLLAQHKYADAIKNQTKGLLLARLAEQRYPTMIDLLFSHVVYHLSLKGMQKILHIGRKVPGIGAAVAQAIEHSPLLSTMSHIIPAETLFGLSAIQGIREEAHKGEKPFEPLEWGEVKIAWKQYGYDTTDKREADRACDNNEAHFLQAMRIAYKSLRLPYYQRSPSDIKAIADMKRQSSSPDYSIATFCLSSTEGAGHYARTLANRAVTITFARVMAWKEQKKHLPNSLEEVLPHVPVDPFDGKPLRYRKEGDDFVVYSVGESLKYDGKSAKVKEIALHYYATKAMMQLKRIDGRPRSK